MTVLIIVLEGTSLLTTLRLASIFSDHMVLCRNRNIRIFGEAVSGRKIIVSIHNHTASGTAVKGQFEIMLTPIPHGGPYTMTVSDGKNTVTFLDVLVGDVYFAGGQSNMELRLEDSEDGAGYAAQANNPMIRYCNFPVQSFLDKETISKEHETSWRVITPNVCGDISAVAFHFAVKLQAVIDVPIGIIGCYLGGTSITSWLDENALSATTGGKAYLEDYLDRNKDKTEERYNSELKAHEIAHREWSRKADAIKMKNPSAIWDDFIVELGPCPWPPPEGSKAVFRPCGLANTMVKRIAPYTITGFLYYQGESDYKRTHLYHELLMTLIAFWRDLFMDSSLPFLNVQLPMFNQRDDVTGHSWPLLRHAQEQVYRDMRNTGLAVMIDCGDKEDIHPADKKTVGERLCLQALLVVYQQDADCDSPRAFSARPEGNSIVLQISAHLRYQKNPQLFEIAGENHVFYPADAVIADTVICVSSAEVEHPHYVRYAWVNYGEVNVFGTNELPLAPFCLQ